MPLEKGDHACIFYSHVDELVAAVVEFLDTGLARGERCWYTAAGGEVADVQIALGAGIDVVQQQARGALQFLTKHDVYIVDDRFDPQRVLKLFGEALEQTSIDGFTGLRICGEMSWSLDPIGGWNRLPDYEAVIDPLCASTGVTALCCYHRERMPAALLDAALATHLLAATRHSSFSAHPFYRPYAVAQSRSAQPEDVAVKLRELDRRRKTSAG